MSQTLPVGSLNLGKSLKSPWICHFGMHVHELNLEKESHIKPKASTHGVGDWFSLRKTQMILIRSSLGVSPSINLWDNPANRKACHSILSKAPAFMAVEYTRSRDDYTVGVLRGDYIAQHHMERQTIASQTAVNRHSCLMILSISHLWAVVGFQRLRILITFSKPSQQIPPQTSVCWYLSSHTIGIMLILCVIYNSFS